MRGNARAGERASGDRGSFAFVYYVKTRRSVAARVPRPRHRAPIFYLPPVTNAEPFHPAERPQPRQAPSAFGVASTRGPLPERVSASFISQPLGDLFVRKAGRSARI